MGNSDVFGGNREVKTGELLTMENAALDLGEGRVALVQNIQIQYNQGVQPQFEVGSNTMYFVAGQARGSLRVDTLVGKTGFLDGFNLANKAVCGGIDSVALNLVDTNNCGWELSRRSTASLEAVVPESVNITISAGQLQIAQSVGFQIGKLSILD